jgi:hypothetical protein
MRTFTLVVVILAGVASAHAAGKAKGGKRTPVARPAAETTAQARPQAAKDAAKPAEVTGSDEARPSGKTPKAKVYTFSGLDVEGKLKTPQLLYFLNRVKLELDTTSPEKRSFLKELEKTSDDKGL